MTYITLTSYALNATGNGWSSSGTEKSLADWGIRSCSREAQNKAQDNVGFDMVVVSAIGVDPFPFGTKIVIQINRTGVLSGSQSQPSGFSGGTVFFVGYQVKNVRSATGRMQSFQYKFTGPWGFFFERHVFQKLWPNWNGTKLVLQPRSQVVLGQSVTTITQANGVETTQQTIAEALIECLTFTLNQTTAQYGAPQFAIDSALPTSNFDGVGGWQGYCPMDAANDLTCAEALKKIVKILPAVSMWFDYSTPIPTFHVATRDTLPSKTLTWGNSSNTDSPGNYTSKIDRRDDIIPPCVDYKYRVTTTVGGQSFVAVYDDLACQAGVTNPNTGITAENLLPFSKYFGAEVATFDFEGGSTTTSVLTTTPIPFDPSGNTDDFAVWTQILCSALTDKSIVQASVNAQAATSVTYPNGAAADTRYQYFMIGGPVPPLVVDSKNPNLQQGVQLQLSCPFKFTDQSLSSDGTSYIQGNTKTETKTCSVVGFSIPSGTFSNVTQQAEAVPFGLAAFVYNIEKVFQYDGSHGVVEYDPTSNFPTITDVCPIGTNLNLSNGLPEYATMNAQVQTVNYDFMTGHTDITFGVASHLGGSEMIERLRINRGPRWLYEIGGGATNNTTAASGPVQLKDTQPASVQPSVTAMPPNGTTSGIDPDSTSGNPGITHDSRTSGQPNYGEFGAFDTPNGNPLPTPNCPIHYLEGFEDLDGTGIIRIATVDCKGEKVAIFEYPICWDFGDGMGLVKAYVRLIGSRPYKTSKG